MPAELWLEDCRSEIKRHEHLLEKDIRTVDPAEPGIEDDAVTVLRDG
jgi:hypothetical protein